MEDKMSALERNVRLRNGRRDLPREIPRTRGENTARFIVDLLKYSLAMTAIGAGMYVAFSVADRQLAIEDEINQETQRLPPCPAEDSDNCHWDAKHQGNGKGRSFTSINGVVTYDQR